MYALVIGVQTDIKKQTTTFWSAVSLCLPLLILSGRRAYSDRASQFIMNFSWVMTVVGPQSRAWMFCAARKSLGSKTRVVTILWWSHRELRWPDSSDVTWSPSVPGVPSLWHQLWHHNVMAATRETLNIYLLFCGLAVSYSTACE